MYVSCLSCIVLQDCNPFNLKYMDFRLLCANISENKVKTIPVKVMFFLKGASLKRNIFLMNLYLFARNLKAENMDLLFLHR